MQEFMTSHHVEKEEHLELLYSIFRRRHQKSYRGRMETSKRKHLFRHNLRLARYTITGGYAPLALMTYQLDSNKIDSIL
jgi:hypothetical protein